VLKTKAKQIKNKSTMLEKKRSSVEREKDPSVVFVFTTEGFLTSTLSLSF